MTDHFQAARTILQTGQLYQELKTGQAEYCGDFMGRTMKRDYLNVIEQRWRRGHWWAGGMALVTVLARSYEEAQALVVKVLQEKTEND